MTPARLAPGRRGHRGPGGGADTWIREPLLLRATTEQVKGLYPWFGWEVPQVGVPLGPALRRGNRGAVTVCGDPISWFEHRLISNPSATVIGGPSTGKSSLIRRLLTVGAYWGTTFWQLGDKKGEYRRLVEDLDGVRIPIGRGLGSVNVLDRGEAPQAAQRIGGPAGEALLADASGRRQIGVEALIAVQRGRAPSELECFVIGTALAELDLSHPSDKSPVLGDLLHLIVNPPEAVKEAASWRGDIEKYYAATDPLKTSLSALVAPYGLGSVFSRQTSVPIDRNRHLVVDISSIDEGDVKLRSAALITAWAAGFGALAVCHALEDAGLEAMRRRTLATDELWSLLGSGLIDRVNALSRLNRHEGVGTLTAFHTSQDLALESAADTAKAGGVIERSGMIFCAGMPRSEINRLREFSHFTQREEDEIVSWATPPTWHRTKKPRKMRFGQGNFLLRTGDGDDRPGLPFHLKLTPPELDGINDTDSRWTMS